MDTRRALRSLASTPPGRSSHPPNRPVIALVLSGGGARGAYEAGVLRYLCEEFPRTTGVTPWFDIVSGTSVGALHACFVASTADVLERSTALLVTRWSELRVDDLLSLRPMEILRFARSLFGRAPRLGDAGVPMAEGGLGRPTGERRGGVIDTRALERFVLDSVPWSRIARNIDEGALRALSVSATHVASGRTVVFVEKRGALPPWSRDPHVRAEQTRITPWHALASAAIPLLFPAVPLDGAYYVDGGLRQNTPLSPAMRLGAERVLVVSLRHAAAAPISPPVTVSPSGRHPVARPRSSHEPAPSPFFIFGKTLNALMIDRVDYDLDRLRRTNAIVEGGLAAFGGDFLPTINGLIGDSGSAIRVVRDLIVRPSSDVGEIAAGYARSPAFSAEAAGLAGRALRRLAAAETEHEADLLSYLLFHGGYARELIELGMSDARSQRDQLVELFS